MYTQAHYAQHVYSSPNILNNYEFLPQLRWESKLWAPQNVNPDIDIWNYLWRMYLHVRMPSAVITQDASPTFPQITLRITTHHTTKLNWYTTQINAGISSLPVSWTHVLSLPPGTSVPCCSAVLATPGAGASAQYRKLWGVTQHCSLADL